MSPGDLVFVARWWNPGRSKSMGILMQIDLEGEIAQVMVDGFITWFNLTDVEDSNDPA